ncbi:MAG: glycerate kinase [Bacteroidota bacterium]
MRVLIAPDKFKGSLSALEVCHAIRNGLEKNRKKIETVFHPMADGGDGSLEILAGHLQLKAQKINTTDPLGRTLSANYFTSSNAAFIEVASASGLVLLNKEERNPLLTSTYGTGKMIADAIQRGFNNIYLFLGGSATNDAGMGIATALGCQFLDAEKKLLQPAGGNLSEVHFIKKEIHFDLKKISLTLLCDVTNPLHGPAGAAHVYARQKGASNEQIKLLDEGLNHFGKIIFQQTGMEVHNIPGSGAAGGIGAGLVALFGAELKSGFAAIAELTGLEEHIKSADWVISGEGKLDVQSLQGKVVDGIARLCKKYRKPLTLFVGKNDLAQSELDKISVKNVFSIAETANDLEDAMQNGAYYLEKLSHQLIF